MKKSNDNINPVVKTVQKRDKETIGGIVSRITELNNLDNQSLDFRMEIASLLNKVYDSYANMLDEEGKKEKESSTLKKAWQFGAVSADKLNEYAKANYEKNFQPKGVSYNYLNTFFKLKTYLTTNKQGNVILDEKKLKEKSNQTIANITGNRALADRLNPKKPKANNTSKEEVVKDKNYFFNQYTQNLDTVKSILLGATMSVEQLETEQVEQLKAGYASLLNQVVKRYHEDKHFLTRLFTK